MLTATLLSALALTQTSPDPWACDLAPSIGQGTSDEGSIDAFTRISFGCRYELFNIWGASFSPALGLDKQMWSVYEHDSGQKNISSYETQDVHAGFHLGFALKEGSRIFYGFAAGTGRGKAERTESTVQTSYNGSFDDLTQTYLSHTIGGSYDLTEKLALTLAYQRQDAEQKWNVKPSDILVQSVDENQTLTLTDGSSTNLVGRAVRSRSSHSTNSVQIGLSLSFGG